MSETPAEYNAKIIAEFRANKGRVRGMWEEIWAANGGAPSNRDWYHNLMGRLNTRIEVGSGTINVVAEEATGEGREHLFARAAKRYPQLAEVARKTERLIPVIVRTPGWSA